MLPSEQLQQNTGQDCVCVCTYVHADLDFRRHSVLTLKTRGH